MALSPSAAAVMEMLLLLDLAKSQQFPFAMMIGLTSFLPYR
jgi:hypothetical protein